MLSWKVPCADGLAQLFESEHVVGKGLAVGQLVGAVGALGIEKIEEAGGAAAIGVLADIAGLFGLVNVAAAIKLNDLVVGAEIFVGVHNVGGNLLRGFAEKLLGLGDGVAGARDFALVAIEDSQGNAERYGRAADARSMRVAEARGEVLLAIGASLPEREARLIRLRIRRKTARESGRARRNPRLLEAEARNNSEDRR